VRLTLEQLTGRDDSHIEWRDGVGLQADCWVALEALQARAAQAGFDLQVASGFRSFERQLAIWNRKARGEQTVHDDAGRPVDLAQLDDAGKLAAILRFSALPGTSRHHWGTDLDVFDAAAMPEAYRLQLVPEEVADDGMFGPMHRWLDAQMAAGSAEGFYRPYAEDRGGVAPERWHLSFAPAARSCESQLDCGPLAATLEASDLALCDAVLAGLPELVQRYVEVPPAPA
jgi:LAS superfamily LD-carboxypeptidase LdcB